MALHRSQGALQRWDPWILAIPLLAWFGVVSQLMIADVWDESRGLDLLLGRDPVELVLSNWHQGDSGSVVLFRPLPFLVFTVVSTVVGEPELVWRGLRWLNVTLLSTTALMVVATIRQLRGHDVLRDLATLGLMLGSASAMIVAGWFAALFDAAALALMIAAIWALTRGRTWVPGLLVGAAFFCKETAVLAFPALGALTWCRIAPRQKVVRAASVAAILFFVYAALRWLVVPPGSAQDVHRLSVSGFATALLRLPATLWWQTADPPAVALGWLAFVTLLAALRSRRAAIATIAVVVVAAAIYGGQVHLGPTPLLHADNFAPRLYLIPATLIIGMLALSGRRWALAVALIPVLWGGAETWARSRQFQLAYDRVYHLAARVEQRPLRIDCTLYREPVHDRRRDVLFGLFPDATWVLDVDGRLRRRHDSPPPPRTKPP